MHKDNQHLHVTNDNRSPSHKLLQTTNGEMHLYLKDDQKLYMYKGIQDHSQKPTKRYEQSTKNYFEIHHCHQGHKKCNYTL